MVDQPFGLAFKPVLDPMLHGVLFRLLVRVGLPEPFEVFRVLNIFRWPASCGRRLHGGFLLFLLSYRF